MPRRDRRSGGARGLAAARACAEDGFVMIAVMGVLLVASLASVAAFAASTGDIKGGADDVWRKQAYSAAEAGIQAYAHHLSVNSELYLECDQVNATNLTVNQRVAPGGARTWNTLSNSSAQYAVEILPANGQSACQVDNPDSVIDATYGTFRVRSTGRPRPGGPTRSIISTFRKPRFTDYIYFTDSEGNNIRFVSGDQVNGPLHTNDFLRICGTPRFGATPTDDIETVLPGSTGNGWSPDAGCGGSNPNVNFPPAAVAGRGTWRHPAPSMQLPESNTALRADTLPAYRFRGWTQIQFNSGGTMTVWGSREDGVSYNNTTIGMPPNGMIYVSNNSCPGAYNPSNPYDPSKQPGWGLGCGNVYVYGTYSSSVTVAAESDVVVRNSLTRSGNAMAGLISNNFIRIWRATNGTNQSCTSASALSSPIGSITVQAAIMSLQQSFTVDNFSCISASPPPVLTVDGAIIQRTRGAVGTGNGGSSGTGYLKNYIYDRRFKYRSPPNFLDPVSSAWRMTGQQEQVPAQ